jgi:ATP-dependent protease Clp ATPase subunit
MLDVMYEIPNKTNVKKVIVTQNCINKGERPIIVMADGAAAATPTPTSAESA